MKCQQVNVSRKILFCLVLLFFGLMSASVTHAETYNFVTKWDSQGNGNGSYSYPRSIAVDSSGYVYVAYSVNDRIEKFDSNGTFLTKWGSYGTGNGQFNEPSGVAVDSSGNVYVADPSNNRIEKFNSTGGYLTQWVCNGSGYEHIYGHYSCTSGIAVDSLGNVYADNPHNSLVQKFNSNGRYLTQWGSLGTGNGQFNGPLGVAVDSSGNVYVIDFSILCIQKFAPNVSKSTTNFADFPSIIVPVAAILVLTVIFRRKKW